MRTAITLEPDAGAIVRRLMRDRGMTFKQAVNEAIRAGVAPTFRRRQRFRTPAFDMGAPLVPVDRALRLAADLEDEELIRKLASRK